jgi:hypothetical protein
MVGWLFSSFKKNLVVAHETKKWPFFARQSRFLQAVAALQSKKYAK